MLSMLVVSDMSGKLLAKVLGALALASVLLIIVAPYRMERVMTFLVAIRTSRRGRRIRIIILRRRELRSGLVV